MKPVSMCWAMSVMVAICVTPGFSSFRRPVALSHPAMLAQDDGPVAVPGSADAPASNGSDDDDDQSGQAANDGQRALIDPAGAPGQGLDSPAPVGRRPEERQRHDQDGP